MQQKMKLIVTIASLFLTSLVTIATSQKKQDDENLLLKIPEEARATKTYLVASNCPQAVTQERITIVDGRIAEPRNRRFFDFGIPAESLYVTYTPDVFYNEAGLWTSCYRSETTDQGIPLIVYKCYLNDVYRCQVTFELDDQ